MTAKTGISLQLTYHCIFWIHYSLSFEFILTLSFILILILSFSLSVQLSLFDLSVYLSVSVYALDAIYQQYKHLIFVLVTISPNNLYKH